MATASREEHRTILTSPPQVPSPTTRIPALLLWIVPFGLVLAYIVVVVTFFRSEAHWTQAHLGLTGISLTLLGIILIFSFLWFGLAYLASRFLSPLVARGLLLVMSKLPFYRRHVVISAPTRPDTLQEVWGRFGILFGVTLGFELLFMLLLFRHGELSPQLTVSRPLTFFFDEAFAGFLLAVTLAPAAPFLLSRVRLRIVDSLEFPLLWLALVLLVIGGTSLAVVVLLPRITLNPALFFTTILVYAPAAWFVALGFSRAEYLSQNGFLRQAWGHRNRWFHFGQLYAFDRSSGTEIEV
ncbi:MAG: hypothetical protein WAN87_10200 [Thermoplasmata archaeon]